MDEDTSHAQVASDGTGMLAARSSERGQHVARRVITLALGGVRIIIVCGDYTGYFLVGGKGENLPHLQIGSNNYSVLNIFQKIIHPQDNISPLQNILRKYPALASPKLCKTAKALSKRSRVTLVSAS